MGKNWKKVKTPAHVDLQSSRDISVKTVVTITDLIGRNTRRDHEGH